MKPAYHCDSNSGNIPTLMEGSVFSNRVSLDTLMHVVDPHLKTRNKCTHSLIHAQIGIQPAFAGEFRKLHYPQHGDQLRRRRPARLQRGLQGRAIQWAPELSNNTAVMGCRYRSHSNVPTKPHGTTHAPPPRCFELVYNI